MKLGQAVKLWSQPPAFSESNHLLFPVKDGVVLGADTRATEGMIVADKNCSKIHYISPNI